MKTNFPSRNKVIKVNIRTWDTLKHLKKENETFNDIIKELLKERTMSISKDDLKAIKYQRNRVFLKIDYEYKWIGLEFVYIVVKNQTDFTLVLNI